MNTNRLRLLMGITTLGAMLAALLPAGCGSASAELTPTPTRTPKPPATSVPPTPTPTPLPVPTATPEPPAGPRPLDAVACGELADGVAQALGIPATTEEALFEDHVNGQTGTGCQIAAAGTGVDFDDIMVVENGLREVLQAQGWQEDMRYMGGGPGAVVTGYRRADTLCLVLAYWEPSEDADCPPDQPVFACELTPEQQVYTITLNCAQGVFSEQATQPPAIVALEDGTQCAFAGTGATLAFDDKRLNYTCPAAGEDQVGLLGDLQQSDGAWTAEKVVVGHDENGFFVKASEIVTVHVVQR